MRMVIALGGNAILRKGQKGAVEEQLHNLRASCRQVAALVAAGHQVLLTHGNGPQVGNLLIQNERSRPTVPAMPLDVCVAQTQGMIGYWIQQTLGAELAAAGVAAPVVTLVTQVVVAPDDPAFRSPTKPVGPFYTAEEARALAWRRGYQMQDDAGRGWRRVVPSPDPLRVVELEAVRSLFDAGAVVLAAGGGGVPVLESPAGFQGVEAVIDKDLAAERLATALGAGLLLLLTDVPVVLLGYGTPRARPLLRVTAAELERHVDAGQFAPGSMLTKVTAALRFVRGGGARAAIAHLDDALAAAAGQAGTHVVP